MRIKKQSFGNVKIRDCTRPVINYKPLNCILLLLLVLLPSLSFAGMNDYCLVPPYVTRTVVPNIMIVYEKGSAILYRAYSTTYDSSTTYYGFFKSTYNYAYDSVNDYFIKSTTCTPSSAVSTNCFSGNVLNWALMSSLDLSRKALIGFGEPATGAGTSAGMVFTYTGALDSKGQGNAATVSAAGYTFCISNATGSNPTGITIRFGEGWANCSSGTRPVNGGDVVMHFTDETRVGIIQRYADDSDENYQYDTDAPRFGVRRWNNGNDKQEDIISDSSLTLAQRESYFRSLLTAISKAPPNDPQTPDLSDMMEQAVNYFKGSSSTYQDNDNFSQTPYSWGTDPMKACRKTYVFFITTGGDLGTTAISSLPAACTTLVYPDEEPYITAGINGTAVTDTFATNTCYAYNTDLYTTDGSPPKQNISTYVVHTTFYGGADDNITIAKLTYAARISDGEYIEVRDPKAFEQAIEEALLDMLRRSVSGTAASVLASGEGSGANLVQAVFYPKTPKLPLGPFSERMDWLGRLSNYWYYIDPFFSTSTILEDTTDDNILDLSNDRTVKLRYDTTKEYAVGDCYDYSTAASANCGQGATPVRLEYLKNLWDAGIQLWNRDITVAANKRKIYTTINGTIFLAGNFSRDADNFDSDNSSTLRTYFNFTTTDDDGDGYKDDDLDRDGSVNDADANILIRYIHGEDFASYTWMRSRTVAVDLNEDEDTSDTVDGISESEKVWKLGDVLNSTPKISSWIQLNTYDSVYSDTTYREFLNSANYTDRGMVFTGANDGMLHAFKLGKLELSGAWKDSTSKKAYLSGSDLGKEIWTFIPKNVLPYLKYLKETLYCHIYTVDLTPYIFDASIGEPASGDVSALPKVESHWRTILIGGMRMGGACKNSTDSCTVDLNGDGTIDNKDCVKTPISDNGYSSYFALDVTDQNNPTLLWEFSNSYLGFTTTGPAILRIGSDTSKNGKWFVVFGSGPTGPISTTDQQFLGNSDQNLRLFVLDLKTGSLLRTIDTEIQYAFAGSILNATHDSDLDYQDDAVYIPYVKKCTAAATYCTVDTWTNGGAGRLLTKEDTNPGNWAWNAVIDNIGPVTSAIAKLRNKKTGKLWLYFGTGRYYFEQSAVVDDGTTQRRLFGIKDPCFQGGVFDASCSNTAAIVDMIDKTCAGLSGAALTICLDASIASDKHGWYIDLDDDGSYTYTEGGSDVTRNYRAERVITDPLATSSGIVFFTAYKPYNDVCAFGGKTFIWAVKYDTGGAAGALLKGIALLQVSTGSIEQLDLSSAFGQAGGRKTAALEGVPPTAQGLSILSTPPPVKRVIHMRER